MTTNMAAAVVSEEHLISNLQSMRDRLMLVLAQYGDAFDGDMDVLLAAINHIKRTNTLQAALGVGGCTWTPQRLFVLQHPLEPDEKVERQRDYARGWNACIDAIEKGIAPPPVSEEG